jgi:hypothetical protein
MVPSTTAPATALRCSRLRPACSAGLCQSDVLTGVVETYPDFRWELQHLLTDGDWLSGWCRYLRPPLGEWSAAGDGDAFAGDVGGVVGGEET